MKLVIVDVFQNKISEYIILVVSNVNKNRILVKIVNKILHEIQMSKYMCIC
jgi:hypothetical protein